MMEENKKLGFTTMFLSAGLMGFVGLFARNINIAGDFIAFSRMLMGLIVITVVLVGTKTFSLVKTTKFSWHMPVAGIAIGLCLAAYVTATQMTTLANAVLLIMSGPVISPVLAAIFLKEKISLRTALLIIAVFIGMMLTFELIAFKNGTIVFSLKAPEDKTALTGDLLGLLSGLFYGVYLFLGRYRTNADSKVRSFYAFLGGAFGIALTFIVNPPDFSMMDGTSWLWLLAMAFFIGFFPFALIAIASKNLSAAELSVVAYFECVVGILVGIFLFGELLTSLKIVGALLIVGSGVVQVLIRRDGQRSLQPHESSICTTNRLGRVTAGR